MTEKSWKRLEGVDLSTPVFPVRARVDGEGILIFRTSGGYRGVERTCPHLKASLADALLVGKGTMLQCAKHRYTFRFADGKGVNCFGHKLAIFEIKIEGGIAYARAIGAT